jgi:hypothetical protein
MERRWTDLLAGGRFSRESDELKPHPEWMDELA